MTCVGDWESELGFGLGFRIKDMARVSGSCLGLGFQTEVEIVFWDRG